MTKRIKSFKKIGQQIQDIVFPEIPEENKEEDGTDNRALELDTETKVIDTRQIKKLDKEEWLKPEKRVQIPFTRWKVNVPIYSTYRQGEDFKEVKQPILLLIRSNYDVDVFEGVPDGIFKLKKGKTRDEIETKEKAILLANSKLLNMKYGETNVKMWIAYEDEATPYPTEVKHDSSLIVKFYEKMLLNVRALKSGQGKDWMEWGLKIALWVFIGGYVMYKMGILDWISQIGVAKASAPQVASTVSETATNTMATIQ